MASVLPLNGSVELTLPDGYNRDVRVNTNNSSIAVRLPVRVLEPWGLQ